MVSNDTAPDQPEESEEQADPLTASAHGVPASHDGSAAFTFELRFSETPADGFSYKTLRDHAFTVTGGEVVKARRLERGKNVRWEITVRPDGDGTVAIVLRVDTENCGATLGMIRGLLALLTLTTAGCDDPEPTATPTAVPTATD